MGKMGAGKDYAYEQMRRMVEKESLTKSLTRISFADQLRKELDETLLPQDTTLFWRKPYSPEIRKLLQWWGTELRRAEDPNYWVKKAEQDALAQERRGFVPVFTDVRFPNEADMIKDHGGVLIKVLADKALRERRVGKIPDHISETALDERGADYVIVSNGENHTYMTMLKGVLEMALVLEPGRPND